MDTELTTLDEQMKEEIKIIKEKYSKLKKEVKDKYKKIEKENMKKEKEEVKKVRKTIPKSLKNIVWDKHIGKEKGLGECDVCKCEIDSKKFDCGHIVSVKNGGETNETNLLPICATCNKSMGIENLNEFKQKYFKGNQYKTVEYENLVHEYISTMVKTSDTFKSVDEIYKKYTDWLCINHNEKYVELTKNIYIDCFGDKTDDIKKYLNAKFGEPKQSLRNVQVRRTNHMSALFGASVHTEFSMVYGYNVDCL